MKVLIRNDGVEDLFFFILVKTPSEALLYVWPWYDEISLYFHLAPVRQYGLVSHYTRFKNIVYATLIRIITD